ncbi:NAD/NADP-dependent octopine/nopaline dehydrogenase family protein [Pseudoalteromonas rubra]|uniref:NAD/NADP-dependent octopine/nopaline dehydrogenase family protein n=1 Tax=Pseudoalteromonas rubra TaxID=43658 RepID=UPI000F7AA0EE|nr:NAD/NADP octopine/nopaline dehydrogenase family protein [Pseudoalteromonas rubra]
MHNIVIVGGGSSAHTAAPLLAGSGHKVSILTRRPKDWKISITSKYIKESGEEIKRFSSEVEQVSDSYEELIPNAEIVLLCVPVYQYPDVLEKVVKNIGSKKTFVGTVYGQGGVNWMVQYFAKKFNKDNVVPFTIGLIPWVCRTEAYGQVGLTYGPKTNNVISISEREDYEYLNRSFLPDLCERHFGKGKFHYCNNFISSTLSVDNQIIHTSRMYGLAVASGGFWEREEDVPLFYKDYDECSAELLHDLDADYEKIRSFIRTQTDKLDFSYMLNYLELERFSYEASTPDILTSFRESPTLGAIKTPTMTQGKRTTVDSEHRFFFDDIYFGLSIAKWIACEAAISTPTIDKILRWAQSVLNDSILDDSGNLLKSPKINGLPPRWGVLSISDLLS